MNALATKTIKGHSVVWAIDGRIYIPRELFDKCEAAEIIDFKASTPRQFENICRRLAA